MRCEAGGRTRVPDIDYAETRLTVSKLSPLVSLILTALLVHYAQPSVMLTPEIIRNSQNTPINRASAPSSQGVCQPAVMASVSDQRNSSRMTKP
jgi:hypothetical protein